MLVNLLSNSIKFSKRLDQVSITVTEYPLEKNKKTEWGEWFGLAISVHDNGIGISDEDRATLFTPYFKTKDEKSRQYNPGGHGLGLYISKLIAQNLGGDLQVKSEYGNGSEF